MKSLWLGIAALLMAGTASAATLKVTTENDELNGACTAEKCSLRDAVIAANAHPDEDTIILPAGVYRIQLFGADDTSKMGDYDITSKLKIIGAGQETTFIQGMKQTRVFDIFGGARVAIENLTISDGDADKGAGIYVSDGAMVSLKSVRIGLNRAIFGGAAMYLDSTAGSSIDSSLFTQNMATSNPDKSVARGGAILMNAGSLSITNSIFSENSTVDSGGAIRTQGTASLLSINNSSFTKNNAGSGGALYSAVGKTLITNSAFAYNQAADYGGALGVGNSTEIRTSTIWGNKAGAEGGGIVVTPESVLVLASTTISHNSAVNAGGIFNVHGSATAKNSIIAGNTAVQEAKNIFTKLTSAGHNLIELSANVPLQLQATDKSVDAAGLGLAAFVESDSAGQSHVPLLDKSPALNAGSCAAPDPLTDQLGHNWVGACDIGAVEAVCGDKIIHSTIGEECEDGNAKAGDGCSDICKVEKAGAPAPAPAPEPAPAPAPAPVAEGAQPGPAPVAPGGVPLPIVGVSEAEPAKQPAAQPIPSTEGNAGSSPVSVVGPTSDTTAPKQEAVPAEGGGGGCSLIR